VSPILGRYQNADRQFYGISAFNMNRGATRYFDIDTASNTFNVNSFQDNGGNLGVKLDHFFIAVRGCNTSSSQKWFKVTDQTCDTVIICIQHLMEVLISAILASIPVLHVMDH